MATDPKKGEPEARRAAAAAAAAEEGLERGPGSRGVNRTKEVAKRAERAGRVKRPTDHTLDLGTETGVASEMARASVEPDWEDNPEHLDTPAEVREDLMDDGLDPMDTGTPQRALFGHFLVHGMADDPGMGGRTPAQLEAEHDMVVAAMKEHGHDHDTPLDVGMIDFGVGMGGGSGGNPFEFDDPWGLTR